MIALFFACVCILLTLSILYIVIAMRARPHPAVQTAKGAHWFFGHMSVFDSERAHHYHVETSKEFNGQSYANLLPFPPKVFITIAPNALNAEWVLKGNFANYEKSPLLAETFGELFGQGIFAVDGAEWARKRKLASHMFSLRTLRDHMMNVFDRHARDVVRELRIKVEDGQGEVDMQRVFFDFTAKTFLEIGFGAKDVEGDGKGSESTFLKFMRKFDKVQLLMSDRFTNPLWRVQRTFPVLSAREREIASLMASLDEFAYGCVADRRKETHAGRHPDLLSRWLQDAERRGDTLSDEYLRDVVMNFMLAGRDTTACCLTWVLYELCSRPTVLAKVLAEIKSTEGLESPYARVVKMTYTEAVIFESLRLHPPVPSDFKVCMHDDVLPDGTPVPAGCFITYRPYQFGRSEYLWGPDAEEFKPERWLGGETESGEVGKEGETDGKHSQYKFLTFNAGRRLCLGKSLAMLEARVMLMHLLPAFECELRDCVAGEEPLYARGLILRVQDGLKVNLTRR